MIKADIQQSEPPKITLLAFPKQYKWNEQSPDQFKAVLRLPAVKKRLVDAHEALANCNDRPSINSAAEKVSSIFHKAAKLSLKMRGSRISGRPKKPWSTMKFIQLEREVKRKGVLMTKLRTGESSRSFFLTLKALRKERKYARRHYID